MNLSQDTDQEKSALRAETQAYLKRRLGIWAIRSTAGIGIGFAVPAFTGVWPWLSWVMIGAAGLSLCTIFGAWMYTRKRL